jgi:checkpoint serine/threonine-protein kinase
MTIHTKAATDDIYEIFNAPLKPAGRGEDDDSADDDDYETDGDYTTDAESTGTTRHIDSMEPNDGNGDDDGSDDGNDDNALSDEKSVSEWSDFSPERHVPNLANGDNEAEDDEQDSLHTPSETPATFSGDENEEASSLILTNRFSRGDEPEEVETPEMQILASTSRTVFVPIPPEDYDPPTRPYRDPVEVANNRLPFMTPITERTEYSINVEAHRVEQTKTPCRRDAILMPTGDDDSSGIEPLSSPLRDIVSAERSTPGKPASSALAMGVFAKAVSTKAISHKGPIIQDKQCNPVDDEVRDIILSNAQPPLAAMRGFYNHRDEDSDRGSEIRKYAKGLLRSSKGASEKIGPAPTPVVLEFPGSFSAYTIKRELGAGAFAPVYMVQNSHPQGEDDENAIAIHPRSEVEALKMESPPTPWEFYMMRLAHSRLGPQHRAAASLSYAHEMHLYRDEAYLFLPYHPHGTLLDVINLFRAESSGAMDEQLAMFFSIELIRTVEALHTKNILHGDLKPDNCLLRLDNLHACNSAQQLQHTVGSEALSSQWQRNGNGGWHSRGITLIDFGRAIDMRAFVPDVQFIADWKTTAQDCAEMREGRPWTWQIDYHGLAGIIHCLLFGKYIETLRCDQGGLGKGGRRYRIRESLKRYWQTELWHDCFELLLNPGSFTHTEEGGDLPVLRSMRAIRERMEDWLETKSDKGVGLKSLIGKLEGFARSRR